MASEALLPTVSDQPEGITRKRRGKLWHYFAPDGQRITQAEEVARLNRIALPPAYTQAWFSPDPQADVLATGTDTKGRRQYRYHPDFRAAREAEKFAGCAAFATVLPLIRARVEEDLARRGLSRERAIASLVRLLDVTHIRVGNECYARENGSFGASTLRMRHVKLQGGRLALSFRAKSGKQCRMAVSDQGLARFVKAMQDVPGQHLFQWLDSDGTAHPIHSHDVNDYLRAITGEAITAKHFRTFAASVLAFEWLVAQPRAPGGLKAMLAHVCADLGNTPAVARKAYVHPSLIAVAQEKDDFAVHPLPRATRWLTRHERGLQRHLEGIDAA
ncbi:DNA topoisomerase IB [Novosphingobium rosa]|uniref:DNA topoisomerase IB n=1 Tax=Novosphingobium rosa TaxID=76978 RepID=UPI00083398CF|nr:DNA topoisomerase IB [Novosphingobium rosa]